MLRKTFLSFCSSAYTYCVSSLDTHPTEYHRNWDNINIIFQIHRLNGGIYSYLLTEFSFTGPIVLGHSSYHAELR